MDGSLEEQRKEENIPLIKMSEGKTKIDYQRTISSIKDPQVRFILLSNSCLIIIIINFSKSMKNHDIQLQKQL